MSESQEPIIDNIILDDSTAIELNDKGEEIVLFSSLKADAKPNMPYKINVAGIDYPKFYSAKCAICNSPHRTLVEHVYIDTGKNYSAVIKFFERHYNAKLNFAQVKHHIKQHCDLNRIDTSGLTGYEGNEEKLARWKYREYELALLMILSEIDDVRGVNARTPDEILKRATVIEKLSRQLISIKQQRDESSLGLPNVFEVLFEIHEQMISEEDKRIIREKMYDLKKAIS